MKIFWSSKICRSSLHTQKPTPLSFQMILSFRPMNVWQRSIRMLTSPTGTRYSITPEPRKMQTAPHSNTSATGPGFRCWTMSVSSIMTANRLWRTEKRLRFWSGWLHRKKHNTALAGFSAYGGLLQWKKTDGMKSDFKADFIPSVFVCSCLFFSVPFDIINRASRLIFSKSSCPYCSFLFSSS